MPSIYGGIYKFIPVQTEQELRIGELYMQCEYCQANIRTGSAVCPECRRLVKYNVLGFGNTKRVQQALSELVAEQHERIKNVDIFCAMLRDYLPDYDVERTILEKAVRAGALTDILKAFDKKEEFSNVRDKLTRKFEMSGSETEFVLASLGYMMGFGYPSSMMVKDSPKKEKKEKKGPTAINFDLKVFGRIDAFKNRIARHVVVKEGFTKLDGYCFDGYGFMRDVELPDTLLQISEYAFSDCKKLEEIRIPKSVKKVEKGAFNACVSLRKVSLPDGILDIGDNTFFCCTSLEQVRIPDSVNSIGENAFSGCGALRTIVASGNIKFIDENAFSYCPQLTVVCTENSYIHKYCIQNKIKFKTSAFGAPLPSEDEMED